MSNVISFAEAKRKKLGLPENVQPLSFQQTTILQALREGWEVALTGENHVTIKINQKLDALDDLIASLQAD